MSRVIQFNDFAKEWDKIKKNAPDHVKNTVSVTVKEHDVTLVDIFYQEMLTDPEARKFLNHSLVNLHLQKSLQTWLINLFVVDNASPLEIFEQQRHVGTVHTRVQVPINLVTRGARLLKHALVNHLTLSNLERNYLVKATQYVNDLMEIAIDTMMSFFVSGSERMARTDEGYRLYSLGLNMAAERERQRAALLEWIHHLTFQIINEVNYHHLPDLSSSEFGLWLHHKAVTIFEGAPELGLIQKKINHIDQVINSNSQNGDSDLTVKNMQNIIKQVDHGVNEIKFLLIELFDRFMEIESGRDSLTHLLNRRYLPSILTKELIYARKNHIGFSILMLDLDHFKKINDTWGHDAGDKILQQASEYILRSVRAGDVVFRFGGEEILVVLVEITPEQALVVAEKIRSCIQEAVMRLPNTETTSITVSIGIANYDGHPDYERIINLADTALYQAKNKGRNCIIVADNSRESLLQN